MTIGELTEQVIFDATATLTSQTPLVGTAQITIRYADGGVSIPCVWQIASLGDNVRLEIDGVTAQQ